MKKELNVLYQFDENYAPFAGISMLSLFSHNKDIEDLHVYCITMNVSDNNIELLNKTAKKYGRKLLYLNSENTIKKMEQINIKGWNGSLATWMKMFIIEELSEKLNSLLYIDCDTLIEDSLCDLCDYDFDGNAMACVADSIGFRHYRRLALKHSPHYFNAGVIFFNLKYFSEHANYYSKMIEHLKNNVERYSLNDQDLLNDYFDGNIKTLSPKYNFQGIHYMYPEKTYFNVFIKKENYYSIEEIADARKHPKIIHFFRALGDYPWEPGNLHPIRKEFEKWKSRSLWNTYTVSPKKRTLFFKIERMLYVMLPKGMFLRLFKCIKTLKTKQIERIICKKNKI